MATVKERLTKLIAAHLGISEKKISYEPDKKFIEDLEADSLDLVEMVMALEEEFKVEVLDDKAEELMSTKSVLDYLEKNVKS